MKYLIGIIVLLVLISCGGGKKEIVPLNFIDSLSKNYARSNVIETNEKDIQFWKNRIKPEAPGIVNELKYAAALINRFSLSGDITDVKKSDSVLYKIVTDFNGKESVPFLALTRNAILQHRFKQADSLLQLAKVVGIKKYDALATAFDVNFELGKIITAEGNLNSIKAGNDYGYQFRQSRMMHYKGDLDSSISAMKKAVLLANTDSSLMQVALSNVADLYIHAGKLNKAYEAYTQCIKMNATDLHSIMGAGWIALMHDNNDSLAEKIFQFAIAKTKSPDPLFKLIQVAQKRGDSLAEIKFAKQFVAVVSDTMYGNMYNKYLIQLYTGILHNGAKAEEVAKKELENRATSQTYSWYVWSLFCNNKTDEAYSVYKKNVSGKPLEGLELYWMGKLMKGLNKGYNANEFFKEAIKNRYDLSPSIVKDLDDQLKE